MDYMLNPSAMQSVFMVPGVVAKSYLKLASAEQLRVLLCALSSISSGIEPAKIADELSIPPESVSDALDFWCEAGVFSCNNTLQLEAKPEKRVTAKVEHPKPTREEIAMMGATDENVVFLLREAEIKFRRPLRFSEMQSLVSLYADDGMDVALILMIVEYAISEGKNSIGFINSTARDWLADGVDTVSAAEEQIEKTTRQRSAFAIVEKVFGLERRKPSTKELLYSEKWIIEWKFTREMLKEAYNICIDANAKISMPYINKILENWHSKGYKTVEETRIQKQEKAEEDGPSYDKELFERMLDRDD